MYRATEHQKKNGLQRSKNNKNHRNSAAWVAKQSRRFGSFPLRTPAPKPIPSPWEGPHPSLCPRPIRTKRGPARHVGLAPQRCPGKLPGSSQWQAASGGGEYVPDPKICHVQKIAKYALGYAQMCAKICAKQAKDVETYAQNMD